ncbi:adenylate/guanylate cyclase domain-containing protein [Rhizobium sp. 32-5/1]|uniref:adenylate/guanylate cyclase domain-containing protein n=1 Tax=Rhizobium sp. 32-5/1 TaxID=3019602 RepID=UPI00240D17F4|nr:adenylate/guanylate cyclase domain-containing protein [Rhizobium sp. 32-5/1]WEZ85227.1 adenylate/guanylate cyclase domain-containing protein [Rhizobium sp. 32-5/1]
MPEISPTQNWLLIAFGLAVSGMIYSLLMYPEGSILIGAVFALFTGMPILAFERRVLLRPLHRRIEKLPTLSFVLASIIVYEVIMSAGYALAGLLLSSLGLLRHATWLEVLVIPFDVFLYALGVCALIIFILRVRDLLGRDVFTSMLISRYRNPVEEERVFLFIDLADSTAFAETHGDLRAQQFLHALFAAFAEPVRRHLGSIDDYVGDAAIVTWPLRRGIRHARCVRCIFDILDEIEANADVWRKNFGQVPRLRAALHGGVIITAEIGVDHHKITYFGDTVNTTARLESLCKALDRTVLISADLSHRIALPGSIQAEDLGEHAVKGRGQTVGILSLKKRINVLRNAMRMQPVAAE